MECRQEQCGVEPAQTGAYERSSDDDSGLALIIGTSIAIINTFYNQRPKTGHLLLVHVVVCT